MTDWSTPYTGSHGGVNAWTSMVSSGLMPFCCPDPCGAWKSMVELRSSRSRIWLVYRLLTNTSVSLPLSRPISPYFLLKLPQFLLHTSQDFKDTLSSLPSTYMTDNLFTFFSKARTPRIVLSQAAEPIFWWFCHQPCQNPEAKSKTCLYVWSREKGKVIVNT